MKTFITFGQIHVHSINGKTIDKDCVAVINHTKDEDGRAIAFELFGNKYSMEYPEKYWKESDMLHYYPRGYVEVR